MQALGVTVKFRTNATADKVVAAGAEVVACATGAEPRRPTGIEGVDSSGVFTMAEMLETGVSLGQRVAVVVQDDHVAPLAFADFVARQGRNVTMFIQTHGPAPLVSRYSAGTLLGRLSEAEVS